MRLATNTGRQFTVTYAKYRGIWISATKIKNGTECIELVIEIVELIIEFVE
jgi:hypothetical protein